MTTCNPNCKVLGQAVIGNSFIIGCVQCPTSTFSVGARKCGGIGEVKLYKKKFQKIGIIDR